MIGLGYDTRIHVGSDDKNIPNYILAETSINYIRMCSIETSFRHRVFSCIKYLSQLIQNFQHSNFKGTIKLTHNFVMITVSSQMDALALKLVKLMLTDNRLQGGMKCNKLRIQHHPLNKHWHLIVDKIIVLKLCHQSTRIKLTVLFPAAFK